jgi:hypothetical protein
MVINAHVELADSFMTKFLEEEGVTMEQFKAQMAEMLEQVKTETAEFLKPGELKVTITFVE